MVENKIPIKNGIKNCQYESKNPIKRVWKRLCYIWNSSTCACEIDKYLKILFVIQ